MAGAGGAASSIRIDMAKIAIVEARYYTHINDPMIEGAKRRLKAAGACIEHISVPGALEIPAAIRLCLDHASFDGFVAIGCVIRGETTHYDLVANESSRGLTDLALNHGALIGNAILTVENEAQAIVRADPDDQDKGGHAAEAVIQLIALKRRLVGKA
jgi:6,7-dimethyl-8-ribityllumazine synthase